MPVHYDQQLRPCNTIIKQGQGQGQGQGQKPKGEEEEEQENEKQKTTEAAATTTRITRSHIFGPDPLEYVPATHEAQTDESVAPAVAPRGARNPNERLNKSEDHSDCLLAQRLAAVK